jgi:hypothetical protein
MNNTNNSFQFVTGNRNKTRKVKQNIQSLKKLPICLSTNKELVNNLITEFSNQHIITLINKKRVLNSLLDKNLILKSKYSKNDTNGPSLYINYNLNNIQVFHLSIHLCPTTFNKNSKAPAHFIENLNKTKKNNPWRTLFFCEIPKHDGSDPIIFFCDGAKTSKNIDEKWNDEVKIIQEVLNEFFNNKKKKIYHNHPFLNNVFSRIKNKVKTFTRKNN